MLIIFFFLSSAFCVAQKNKHDIKVTEKSSCCIYDKLDDYKDFLGAVAKKNTEALEKKYRKEYADVIKDKNTDLFTDLEENRFIFDTVINKYLGSVFYYILEKNGLDKSGFHFFVNRTSEVNAYTYEDGTVICNLGLLNVAETESQIAMIFCHELAHYLLNHCNNSIVNSIEKFNSPEFIAQVKEIKKEKFNTKKQLEELLITDLFNRKRHNRSQEMAADSLGMILFGKTNYSSAAVPHVFNLLDSSETLVTKCTIKSFFANENLKADESWFATKKKMTFGGPVKKEITDTLRTHPDCAKRKIYAENYFGKHPNAGTDFFLSSKQRLNYIKDQAIFEQAKYAKDNERLSYYLYQLIQNDARFVSDKNIKTEILSTWVDFCFRLKKHTLGYVIDIPYTTENEKDEYAKFLKMLNQIDLADLKEIALTYYEKNKNFIQTNSALLKNLNDLKQL